MRSLSAIRRFVSVAKFASMDLENALAKANVLMKDKDTVMKKLNRMANDQARKLQVISDFDHTMSRSKLSNGDPGLITHDIFTLDGRHRDQINALNQKYMPIEHDPEMSQEEKTPHMVEWWSKAHDIIAQLGITRKALEEIVHKAALELRDECPKFIQRCQDAEIPVLIFSAGLGDIIEIFLKRRLDLDQLPYNVHIVSNFMDFDDKNTICGFRSPLIHAFNKNATVVQNDVAFFEQLESRANILLLGDSVGDLHMDTGIANEGVILKIGYFNRQATEKALKPYLSGFDIVLVGDQTFDVPMAILNSITGKL